MEKIKMGSHQFDLVPNGVNTFVKDQLAIILQMGDTTLDVLESIVTDSVNTQRIEVLDADGSLMQPLTGYTQLQSIKKTKDYLIETIYPEESEEQPAADPVEVRADVAEIVLTKSDLRADVEKVQADMAVYDSAIADLGAALSEIAMGGM